MFDRAIVEMSIIFASLLISSWVSIVLSECAICNTVSSVACVSETSFQYCFEAETPSSETIECPKGYKCVGTAEICSKTGTPACISECGKCSKDKKFACMSKNTFALCLGTEKPSNITNKCPGEKICSIEAANFCDTDDIVKSSCTGDEVAPTEPPETPGGGGEDPKPSDPNEICKKIGLRGRYPINGDSTCQKYIYCYYLNNQLVGKEFSCPGSTVFNPTTQTCVSPETMRCQRK